MTISKFPPENPAVVMSDTQPSTKVDGTIWVDTDSDVPVVNPSDYVANALVNAKGDLITATADDTPARLAVGTNGQALLADSTQATGLRWGSVATSGEDDQIVLGVQVFG